MSLLDITAVDFKSILSAAAAIAGLPIAWNIIARNEHKHHTIEHIAGGKRRGVYFFALCIFAASTLRDTAFQRAIAANPSERVLPLCVKKSAQSARVLEVLSVALVGFGATLVVSSLLRLGITGTYLGECFGIRTKECATKFPFSHFRNPMYLGATMSFLGASVAQNSGVGVVLTAWLAAVYHVAAVYFERPFAQKISAKVTDSK